MEKKNGTFSTTLNLNLWIGHYSGPHLSRILQNYYIIKVGANTWFIAQIGGFRFCNICVHGPANFFNNPMNVILSRRQYFLFSFKLFEPKNYCDNNIYDGRTCYQGQEDFIFHLIHSTLFLLEEYHLPDSSFGMVWFKRLSFVGHGNVTL